MATGTIKNQHTGTWTSINANLKYQVRSGIVFAWVQADSAHSDWATVGTLPSSIAPDYMFYNTSRLNGTVVSNYRIEANGTVSHSGGATSSTIMSYPLP